MNQQVVIHIGFPKTGTKWLQRKLFPNAAETLFFDSPATKLLFCEGDNSIIKRINPMCRNIIFSSERLSGLTELGWEEGREVKRYVNNIAQLYPQATIVVFIRNQLQMLETLYWQYLRNGGNYSPRRYFSYYFYNLKYRTLLSYNDVLNIYASFFGNIIVYPFELFQNSPSAFIDTFSNKLNIDFNVDSNVLNTRENVRLSSAYYPLIRIINLFTKEKRPKTTIVKLPKIATLKKMMVCQMQKRAFFAGSKKDGSIFSEEIQSIIKNEFAKSNILLSQQYNLPLRELGYPM